MKRHLAVTFALTGLTLTACGAPPEDISSSEQALSTTGANYPHNIVLEVGSELGVLGLLALAAFVISVFVRLLRLVAAGGENAGWSGLVLTLFVFSLVNAQFSGDIPYNSGLWLWGGIASGLAGAARAGSHYAARQRS